MKVHFLGTNGWYDTDTGNTISILLDYKKYYIILDAGYGFAKVDNYIVEDKPVYLFLSHFHLDHIVGLHSLIKMPFKGGLTIFGQKGTREHLGTILSSPFTISVDMLPYDLKIVEISDTEVLLPFNFISLPLEHSEPCYGLRLEIEDTIIAYCPDTGYCENAVKLAENSDLVITECAYRPGETYEGWPHLNPENAAQIALRANAKKLALVHFDALRYKTFKDRKIAEKTGKKYFKEIIASRDGMVLKI